MLDLLKELLSAGALIVAIISLVTTLVQRRGDATQKSIDEKYRELNEELRLQDEAWREAIRELRSEFDGRMISIAQRLAEVQADTNKTKLELVQATGNVPTREQLTDAIDRALAPIVTHVTRTERFITRIYESGILRGQDNGT